MIRHIVLFQLISEDAAEREAQVAEARRLLEALVGVVPGLVRMDVREDVLGGANSDFAVDADFDDLDALKGYIVHPEHVKAADYIGTIRKDARAAIDFEV